MSQAKYHISSREFIRKYQDEELGDAQLIDVREPYEWQIVHLKGFQLIPLGDLPARYSELDRNKPVYLLCAHGIRSIHAANWLLNKGFSNVINIDGGLVEIEKAIKLG